jgi:hypothetical protein
MLKMSSASASGMPWKLPAATTLRSARASASNTSGLSVTAPSSRSTTERLKFNASRQAPST